MRRDGSTAATLRGVAPPTCCDFAAFDCDGDGSDEIVVWRHDVAGHGALTMFHFGPGLQLVQTLGPFHGAVLPGARVGFVVGPFGERLLVSAVGATQVVRQFDGSGVPGMPTAPAAAELLFCAGGQKRGDFDGDAVPESAVRRSDR